MSLLLQVPLGPALLRRRPRAPPAQARRPARLHRAAGQGQTTQWAVRLRPRVLHGVGPSAAAAKAHRDISNPRRASAIRGHAAPTHAIS